MRTRALCLPSRHGGHGARVRPGAGRKTWFVTELVVAPGAGIRVGAGAGIGVGSRPRALMSVIVVTHISWLRCRRVARLTLPRCSRLS